MDHSILSLQLQGACFVASPTLLDSPFLVSDSLFVPIVREAAETVGKLWETGSGWVGDASKMFAVREAAETIGKLWESGSGWVGDASEMFDVEIAGSLRDSSIGLVEDVPANKMFAAAFLSPSTNFGRPNLDEHVAQNSLA